MDDRSVCTPLHAESDAEYNTSSAPNAASVTDADKVINTTLDSSQVKGDQDEEELPTGLLTDDYCHVCEAELLFESQRLSHYEGKKHAQKLKLYLQAKRAEKKTKDSAGPQRAMIGDKDRFCDLCNMVFSSPVVAQSHYNGKVHAKKLRKHQPTVLDITCAEMHTSPSVTQASANADQKSAQEGVMEHLQAPAAPTASLSAEVDLKDPNRYCTLCTASFNNPQMALQHYNGRKHQKNQARQDLLKELGEDVQQANSLMCQMCSVEFESVEMYQAHMQGNKHQIREKKVVHLCKSQQKVYNSFADELADYIQVQKARGIAPKNSQLPPQVDREKEDEEDVKEVSDKADIVQVAKLVPNFPPTSNSPHQSHPVCYYPVEGWRPPYHRPVRGTSYGWNCNVPPSAHPGLGSPQFTSQRTGRRKRRKQSSSSSYTSSSSSYSSSSYSSSYSSSTSDSDDDNHRHREKKRRTSRNRKEGGRKAQDRDSDKEPRRRKVQRRVRDKDSAERRRKSEAAESEERRRKRRKKPRKARRGGKTSQEEEFEEEGAKRAEKEVKPQDLVENRKGSEVHAEAEMNLEQQDGEQDEPGKAKYRKEKKRTKEKVDTRTEEEKLWDESILGC